MGKNLAGLNYDSKLNIDDLTFQSDEVEKAILDRTSLVFGGRSLSQPRYGIVDVIDPRDVISDETTRPLLVYASTTNPTALNVNVSSGSVVTSNGTIVMNPLLLEDFSLARKAVNDINIIFIENEIIDSPPKRKTRYNVDQYTRKVQNSVVIKAVLLSDFQNGVLYPPQRLGNIVVLAVITVVQNISSLGLELQIDYSNSIYLWNRPWYSPVDVEHRSMLGSGTATISNPHAISYNNLSSGNLTLYDQLLDHGLVLAKDEDIKGVAGTPCYDVIEKTRILLDGTAGVTAASRFGGSGKYYIELAYYPTQITAFYLQANRSVDIAWEHVPGTKLVVLPNVETFTSTAVIEYNRVYALEPPQQIFSNTLSFGQPNITKEIVITGGLALSQLSSQYIEFDGSGPVPRRYTIYAKSDGTILRTPQTIQTPILLDDVGLVMTQISASFFGPAKLSVGLAGASTSSSMSIVIRLWGRDGDDIPLTEDITFSGSTWSYTQYLENPNQYILTTNIYKTLTSYQVVSRSSDGPNSKIQMWAELETGTTLDLNKLAKTASVMWDGTGISELLDKRQITKSIPIQRHRFAAAAGVIGLGGSSPKLAFSEDFASPVYRNTPIGYVSAIASTVRIQIQDYSRFTAGDTIVFPYLAKTLTVIITGSPNRGLGQFLRTTSNQATRDEIIATINDVAFASGYTAIADSTPPLGEGTLLVTATASAIGGARGNGLITITTVQNNTVKLIDALQNSLTGLVGGIDAFGECFFPKHMDSIDTDIPSSGTYDVTSYRYRYQSIPFPIGTGVTSVKVVVHGVPVPQTNIQLRARTATAASPVWLPWEVISGSGALFTITKSSGISKIQLQLFGEASGYSVYEV